MKCEKIIKLMRLINTNYLNVYNFIIIISVGGNLINKMQSQ